MDGRRSSGRCRRPRLVRAVDEREPASTETDLAAAGANSPETIASGTGYRSSENLTVETSAELLITPMSATRANVDHDKNAITRRADVFAEMEAGSITITDAAHKLGISCNWALRPLDARRHGRGDSAVLRQEMLDRLATDEGRTRYAKRKTAMEPVFGNIKANLHFRRVSGRGLAMASSEWKLVCTVHNLLKVRNHRMRLA